MIAAIVIVLLFPGLVLLVLGLRGRRVGDEPHCRRCRYNLTGLGADRCPECGSLLATRSVVRGVRRRRKRNTIAGCTFLFLAVLFGVPLAYLRAKGMDPYPYLPSGMVVTLARLARPEALSEAFRRATQGRLTPRQAHALVESGLRVQALPMTTPITHEWLSLLDRMDELGLLSAGQRDRYLREWAELALVVRPGIRAGDPVPIGIGYAGTRSAVWRSSAVIAKPLEVGPWKSALSSSGAPAPLTRNHADPEIRPIRWGMPLAAPFIVHLSPTMSTTDALVCPPLVEGTHTLTMRIHCLLSGIEWDEVLTTEVRVLPAGAEMPCEAVMDSRIEPEIARSLRCPELTLVVPPPAVGRADECGASTGELPVNEAQGLVRILLKHDELLPIGLSADAVLVAGDQEIPIPALGGFYRARSERDLTVSTVVPCFELDEVALELRPNPRYLLETLDQSKYWGKTIRLVPLDVNKTESVPAARLPGDWPLPDPATGRS